MSPEHSFRIETYERLASTQDALRERIRQGEEVHALVIRALEQSAGRGQRSHDWQSSLGGSYQTLALKDTSSKLTTAWTTLAIAIGLAETLLKSGIKVGIKWPNDLYYPFRQSSMGKKVAGILCEYVQGYLLIGVGVNVNNPVPETATALRGLATEDVSNLVLEGIKHGLMGLSEEATLMLRFAAFDVLKDKLLALQYQGEAIMGIAKGIDLAACLKLETGLGMKRICHSEARTSLQILSSRK